MLIGGNQFGELYVADMSRAAVLFKTQAHNKSITQMQLMDDGVHLVTSSVDKSMYLWRYDPTADNYLKPVCRFPFTKQDNPVDLIKQLRNGTILTAYFHGLLLTTKFPSAFLQAFFKIGDIKLWDMATCRLLNIWPFKNSIMSWRFAEKDPYLITGSLNGLVSFWNLKTGSIDIEKDTKKWLYSFELTNRFLFAGSVNGELNVYKNDQYNFKFYQELKFNYQLSVTKWIKVVVDTEAETKVAAIDSDGRICYWSWTEATKFQLVRCYTPIWSEVKHVQQANNGEYLFIVYANAKLAVVNLNDMDDDVQVKTISGVDSFGFRSVAIIRN